MNTSFKSIGKQEFQIYLGLPDNLKPEFIEYIMYTSTKEQNTQKVEVKSYSDKFNTFTYTDAQISSIVDQIVFTYLTIANSDEERYQQKSLEEYFKKMDFYVNANEPKYEHDDLDGDNDFDCESIDDLNGAPEHFFFTQEEKERLITLNKIENDKVKLGYSCAVKFKSLMVVNSDTASSFYKYICSLIDDGWILERTELPDDLEKTLKLKQYFSAYEIIQSPLI